MTFVDPTPGFGTFLSLLSKGDLRMINYDDFQDAQPETFGNDGIGSRKSDLIQTLMTVPLLAASATAMVVMLPAKTTPSTATTIQSASVVMGPEGYNQTDRRQRVVLARMERLRVQGELNSSRD